MMRRRKNNRFDNAGIGAVIGLALPILIFLTVYLFGDHNITFAQYLNGLWQLHALIKLGSLCVFVNSAAFMLSIKLKYEKTARGILGATIVYAFVVLISRAF